MSNLRNNETPYAVYCREHGRQFLTKAQYIHEMNRPNSRWTCPTCGEVSGWDDDWYEAALEGDAKALERLRSEEIEWSKESRS